MIRFAQTYGLRSVVPTQLVNLDALILREVLEVEANETLAPAQYRQSFAIGELASDNPTYSVLRKPDFQRATGDWSPEMVADLVKSFISEELIPSVILWRSPGGNLFVIDGAHRLSAFIAWINDDYGDGTISKAFFQDRITKPQQLAADKTRELIETASDAVGSYAALKAAGLIHHSTTERAIIGRKMASNPIPLQWVVGS
jgi:Protein of unknown function DUF262